MSTHQKSCNNMYYVYSTLQSAFKSHFQIQLDFYTRNPCLFPFLIHCPFQEKSILKMSFSFYLKVFSPALHLGLSYCTPCLPMDCFHGDNTCPTSCLSPWVVVMVTKLTLHAISPLLAIKILSNSCIIREKIRE